MIKLISAKICNSKVPANNEADMEKGRKLRMRRNIMRFGIVCTLCVSILASFGCTAFATTTIADGISSGMDQFYSLLRMISIPVAAVAVAAAAFQIFTGGEKGMEKAKKIIIYAGIGIGIALLGPLLVKTIAGWFSSVDHTVTSFTN